MLAHILLATHAASYVVLTKYGRVCERCSPCFKKSGLELTQVQLVPLCLQNQRAAYSMEDLELRNNYVQDEAFNYLDDFVIYWHCSIFLLGDIFRTFLFLCRLYWL
jgi:hypothetical protein